MNIKPQKEKELKMSTDNKPDHANRDHAEFSPSSLKYVAGCAGYQGRDGTSAAAEKGTRIHEALEELDPSALHDEEELEIYWQIVKDEEAFLSSVLDEEALEDAVELNEVQVDVELDGVATWGTCDRLTIAGKRAVMGDYKTGISVIDTPKENWQAKAYALGAFQKYPEIEEIIFVFYIPVRDQVLSDVFTRDDVPSLVKELSDVISRGEVIRPQWEGGQPDMDDLNPTVNCRFCRHEGHCPALGGLAIEVATRVSETIPKDIDINNPKDPEVVEQLWLVAKVVTNWASRVKAQAVAQAKDGMEFPSLRLRSMGATRKCTDNNKLLDIAEEFGVTQEDMLDLASVPLKKLAGLAGQTAEEGEKLQKTKDFLDAVEDASIIDVSETRYTLS